MHRCLELAAEARGLTGINPMVGAVLVRDGVVIAEAFHSEFGKAHAERGLVQKFEQEMRSTDTLYVNLEPCCHTDKKTPPCAQFLVERGVKRLVYGMLDPNPRVQGEGIAYLRSNGVECIGPVLLGDSLRLNRGFVSWVTKGRPWITTKIARTRSGETSSSDESRLMITSEEQDRWSHRFLRARHDAILVGINTILRDDPQLNIRHGIDARDPYRIILDPKGKIPTDATVLSSEIKDHTIVISASVRAGSTFVVPLIDGVFDWKELWKVLTTPDGNFHGISSILLEGGPTTWKIFKDAGMIDEEIILVG